MNDKWLVGFGCGALLMTMVYCVLLAQQQSKFDEMLAEKERKLAYMTEYAEGLYAEMSIVKYACELLGKGEENGVQ